MAMFQENFIYQNRIGSQLHFTDLCLVGDTHKELDNDEIVRRVNPVFRRRVPTQA